MRRKLLIVVLFLVAMVAAGGAWFWNEMTRPLYQPGLVRQSKTLRAPLTPPGQGTDAGFWTVEPDIRLHHFSEGTGTNVLVVHGGPGVPFAQPLEALKPLTRRYRFHYYDQRGSGQSSRPFDRFASSNYYENLQALDGTLGLGAQIADIERIRQILGEEQLIMVGHSYGGFLAALYGAEFPERVKALVLVAPAELLVMPPESGGLFEQVRPLLPEAQKKEYEGYLQRALDYGSLFSKSEAELALLNAEFSIYYSAAARTRGWTIPPESQAGTTGGWMVQAQYMSMGLKHNYRSALKQVHAPVLVLHGDLDLQPEAASRLYADLLDKAEFRVLAQAGHLIYNDQPVAFGEAMGEFLDRVK